MRGLYIIVEGQTEEEFVNEVLRPYLYKFGIIDIRAIKIQTSPGFKGGDVSYQRFKLNIKKLLAREQDIIVTSLIDYYKLNSDFPSYKDHLVINNKLEKITFLEDKILEDINHQRFIPYIQLHEFESLLFSDIAGFNYIPNISAPSRILLNKAINLHPNPELLNDGEETAPSKRLKKLIPSYQKTFHGPIIASEISIEIMRNRCIRFNCWLELLIKSFSKKNFII